MIQSYDAHIYYPLNAREKAQVLRDKAEAELAVLVHENTGNYIRDHSIGAFWMGKVLELDFSKLDPA